MCRLLWSVRDTTLELHKFEREPQARQLQAVSLGQLSYMCSVTLTFLLHKARLHGYKYLPNINVTRTGWE